MKSGQSTIPPRQGECAWPVLCLNPMTFDRSYAPTSTVSDLSDASVPDYVLEGFTVADVSRCFSTTKHLLDAGGHLNFPPIGGYG
ncbi:hypothetical protein PsAD2_00141 [Pseudovibrio axinellae]|uniref:Uncharacterized protein n=1 Tax=Pseudovibrio axinellae TaxID=989403 RepID=A0A166BC68_9HYPH|nr:hypothetical protein [Pseudovibrio axinellae]KZL22115.1 hypothetical protein PsAD2_00141 [Pseudovibrio axinellae]SEQ54667.1 hypothetical protein SAMN05421798_10358 [Pseudovibrio axinellae]